MSEPQDKLERIEARKKLLTPRELFSFNEANRKKQADVALTTRNGWFELFLNGLSCDDIRKANPGFSLGQIVRVRVEDGWDHQVEEHRLDMNMTIRENTAQIQLESLQFIRLKMAAIHKLHGEKYARYLQTGDESHIAGLEVGGKAYKDMLELLLKATGQEKKTLTVQGEITHKNDSPASPLTAAQADTILRFLEAHEKK